MGDNLEVLKKYMVNPMHDSLCDNISSFYFLHNFQTIFHDEEIYSDFGILQRCFSCLSEYIEKTIIPVNEITSFLRNNTSYNYSDRIYIANDILDLCKKINLNIVEITYCKVCHRIVELFDIPYVFYFNLLNKLHSEQDTIFKEENNISNGEIIYCPRCNSIHIGHTDVYFDERGEVEYDVLCKDCGYFISHFAYGSSDYPHPYQLEIFNEKFQNTKIYHGKEDIEDILF